MVEEVTILVKNIPVSYISRQCTILMIIVKLYFCTVTLQGDVSFRGFLIQARTAGTTTPIGEFTSLQSGSQTLSCSGVSSASVS